VVAPAGAVPEFLTVPDSVIALVSFGDAGVHVVESTTRSGFGAGTPMAWSSAICPALEPVFVVMRSRTSAVRAVSES
jgi:hypothetical protein